MLTARVLGPFLRIGALVVAVLLQTACASTSDGSANSDQPDHDDSNGWGTSFRMQP